MTRRPAICRGQYSDPTFMRERSSRATRAIAGPDGTRGCARTSDASGVVWPSDLLWGTLNRDPLHKIEPSLPRSTTNLGCTPQTLPTFCRGPILRLPGVRRHRAAQRSPSQSRSMSCSFRENAHYHDASHYQRHTQNGWIVQPLTLECPREHRNQEDANARPNCIRNASWNSPHCQRQ